MADVNSEQNILMAKDAKENTELTIYPRDLYIAWGEDSRYWEWFRILLENDYKVEIPRLLDVCWLEIAGKFGMTLLTAGVEYEVQFVVMMKNPEGREDSPVTLRLDLPDGESNVYDTDLSILPTDEWVTLPVGKFIATGIRGRVEFSMKEITKLLWKRGLIIKCVLVVPIYNRLIESEPELEFESEE